MSANTYAQDIEFLGRHTQIVELAGDGDSRVAVAPAYQGRIMTSTLAGGGGASFGWINAKFITSSKDDPAFNNYGGEDRFWLGPEAGQFGLWFKKGDPFDVGHWKTPPGFNAGPFEATAKAADSIAMTRRFEVANFSGESFSCAVERAVATISRPVAAKNLGADLPADLPMVAFESRNKLTNAGRGDWTKAGGLVSIWILGQFKPLPRGKVIVPFKAGDEKQLGPRATTDYFGKLPPERCKVADDHLLLVCDGKYRSKIGISPARAKSVLGSYDFDANVLTIAQFNLPDGAGRLPYVNSLWQMQEAPFGGDAVNSYNDGEAAPGAGQLGPFYELETSSPAAELKAGESITHTHRTYHFAGKFEDLNALAKKVLGVDLTKIA